MRGRVLRTGAAPAEPRGCRLCGWTKLPCLRPLEGLQAAGSLPNRRRCWGRCPQRCLAGLPPRQTAAPGAGKPIARQRAWAGGYFLVACVARRGPGATGRYRGGLLRGGEGVRLRVRRKPESSLPLRRRRRRHPKAAIEQRICAGLACDDTSYRCCPETAGHR